MTIQTLPPTSDLVSYTEFTAGVSITATTEAGANTLVTAPALAADGATSYLIEFAAPQVANQPASGLAFVLYDGATSLGFIGQASTGTTQNPPVNLPRRLTPSAGSHTYSIRAFSGVSGASVFADTGGAGKNVPGFIQITKAK